MISTVTHIQATVCEVVNRDLRGGGGGGFVGEKLGKKVGSFSQRGAGWRKTTASVFLLRLGAALQWSEDAEVPSQFSRDAFTVEAKSNEGSLDTEELNRSRVECQARTVSPLQKVSGK